MTIQAIADPEPFLATRQCSPFGSTRPAPWSLATLACANVFFGAAEPDPDVVWDEARVDEAVRRLADIDDTLGTFWQAGAERSADAACPAD